jgi:hypothetical protein
MRRTLCRAMSGHAKRTLAIALFGVSTTLTTWLSVGFYEDREWGDRHVFLKHRPTLKVFFRAPRGEADKSSIPGHEGHLSTEASVEEAAYVEFVEAHDGHARSVALPMLR